MGTTAAGMRDQMVLEVGDQLAVEVRLRVAFILVHKKWREGVLSDVRIITEIYRQDIITL